MNITLTDEERLLLVQALAIAAHQFDADAKMPEASPHTSREFYDNVRSANALAGRLRKGNL